MGLSIVVTGAGGRQPVCPARRPAHSVLDNAVVRLSGVPLRPDFRVSVPRLVESLA